MNASQNSEMRWQILENIFNEVSELSTEERPKYLSELRFNEKTLSQELQELIEAEKESKEFLDKPISLNLETLQTQSFIGETISHYKIIEEIGIGGMGVVYKAIRDDGEFEQKVAIKLTNRGLFSDELLRRFKTERQILANLEHPNIVKLLDGGITNDKTPYFVMEYIEGIPLNVYCRENKLEINQRLKLFTQICEAVGYAHRNLIVHRDLKPNNILVTKDGQVKLLDFGIAKILDNDSLSQTVTQNAPLTPAYSSPEQIKGESISTASDIFSLGIILYEILTEKSPNEIYGVKNIELPHAICETDPNRPSYQTSPNIAFNQLNRQAKTDLDNIVLKALRKEPNSRYNSIEQFSDDINAYLNGLPVKAHPQSFKYRASKFYQRNWLAVSVVGILLLLVLTGAGIAIWQAVEARKQQALAEQRFEQVRKVANSLIFEYHDEIAKLEGSTKLQEKLVVEAVNYLDAISQNETNDPILLKEMAIAYRKIGDIYGVAYANNLGKLNEALTNYQKSVELIEKASILKSSDELLKNEFITSLSSLSMAYLRTADYTNADETILKAISISENLKDNNSLDTQMLLLRLKLDRADKIKSNTERLEKYSENIPTIEKLQKQFPGNEKLIRLRIFYESRTGNNAKWIGFDATDKGDKQTAMNHYLIALEHGKANLNHSQIYETLFPNDARNLLRSFVGNINIADVYVWVNKFDDAKIHLEKAKDAVRQLQKDANNQEAKKNDLDILNTEQNLLIAQDEYQKAVEILNQSLNLADELSKADPKNSEIVMFKTHFAQKAVKLMTKLNKPKEVEKYSKIQNELEERLRTEFNYEGEMKFYF